MDNKRRMIAEFDAAIGPFQNKIDQMSNLVKRWKQESETGFREVDEGAKKAGLSLGGLFKLTSALGSGAALGALLRYSDTAKQMANQMRAVGAETEIAQGKIYSLAIQTRTPIEATVGLLRSMQKSLKDQSLDTTIRQVGTLNRLLTIGGLDGASRGSVSLQFGQALQSGVLQGDELRSLREAAPVELLEAIAKAAGGTVESLRDMGANGQLTRDVMVRALTDLEETSKRKFGDFEMTVAEASDALRTAMVATSKSFNEGFQVTDKLAAAQQAVAIFMLEHADSARELGKALAIVADLALVLAGTRGFLLLGSSVSTAGAKFLTLQRSIGATGAAMASLRPALALMGGPWGLAIFAAGAAFMALRRNVKDFGETVKDVDKNLEAIRKLPEQYEEASKSIITDLSLLEAAEKKVVEAIQSQGEAAQITAVLERDAIADRISKNRELLGVMLEVGRGNLQSAKDGVNALKMDLRDDVLRQIGETRAKEYTKTGDITVFDQPIDDAVLKDAFQTKFSDIKDTAPDQRTKDQTEFLEKYLTYLEKLDALAKEEARLNTQIAASRQETQSDLSGDAAVAEAIYARAIAAKEAQRKADAALLEEYSKGNGELKKLKEDRAKAIKALDGAIQEGNAETIQSWVYAIGQVDDKIEAIAKKMGTPQSQIEAMMAKTRDFQKLLAELPADKSGSARSALSQMLIQLAEAKTKGSNLDEVSLGGLTSEFSGVIDVVNELLGSMGLLGASLDEVKRKNTSLADVYGDYGRSRNAGNIMSQRDGVNAASTLIRAKEGMREDAYWDVNHWRVGYGSDTKTSLGGGTSTVTQSTKSTEAEAERDLQRRIRLYFEKIKQEVGAERFDVLSAPQQGVLASLLHNYGEGEFRAGGDLSGVRAGVMAGNENGTAAAIAKLGTHNNGVNMKRRQEEASIYGDPSAADAALEQFEKWKTARENFVATGEEYADRARLDLEMLGKTASEQAYLTTKFELMAQAKRDGIKLDEQIAGSTRTYREEIEALSRAAEADMAAQQKRADALEDTKEKTDFMTQAQEDLKMGLIDAIVEGDNFADVLGSVAKMFAKAALEAALFNTGAFSSGGGSGALGGIFSAGMDWIGSLFGGGSTPAVTASANGNIMTSSGPLPLKAYSSGGIASTPQLSLFGEGSTPEAYVPLPDGRSIPVTLKMPDMGRMMEAASASSSGASATILSVNVYENAAEGETTVDYSAADGRLDIMLRKATQDMIEGGQMDKPFSRRFGITPVAQGR